VHLSFLPDWNSIESVRAAHSLLEGMAIAFFVFLAGLEAIGHMLEKRKHELAEAIEVAGLCVFAIAVIAEFHAYPYSRRLDALSEQQDRLQKERIAELENSTQGLKTEAEKAHKQAEDEAMARVEIEDRVAWRRLSDKQKLEISARLTRFSGQYVAVMYIPRDDQEAGIFSSDIKRVLGKSKWDTSAPQMRGVNPAGGILASAPASIDTGVTVETTDDAASKRSSRTLCNELVRNGFDCRVLPKFLGQFKPVVWVTVEHRPEGPQGEGKLREQKAKKP
jgi:hypothetical protein